MNSKTLSLIALILAITFPLVGFIVGLVALSKASKEGGDGKGLAVAVGVGWGCANVGLAVVSQAVVSRT